MGPVGSRGRARSGDPAATLEHGPHAPEGPRVGQGITVEQYEIRGHPHRDAAGLIVAEQLSAGARRRDQRFAGREACRDE